MLVRGLFRRCPLCSSNDCFSSFFRSRERCPRCNLSLDRVEGNWIGAVGINTIVTFGLVGITLIVSTALTWPEINAIPVFLACLAIAVLVPILFFPSSRMIWCGIDLVMRPIEPRDEITPEWVPGPRPRRPRLAR
jgi:uncharacterized protein (DUF983 family)